MSYQVREFVASEDHDRLEAIWASSLRNLITSRFLPERRRWLYEDNPEGATETTLGVHAEQDEPIGCGSMVPVRIHLGGEARDGVAAGILSDLAVVPEHRTAGPALKILRAVAKRGLAGERALLFGAPNPKSKPIFKRIKFRVVGETRTWVKPLRSERKVAQHVPVSALAKPVAFGVDQALRLVDWLLFFRNPRPFRSAIAERPDARYDDLWARCRPHLVTVAKTRRYLDWRYTRYPTDEYRFFEMTDLSGRLEGWVAYYVKDGTVLVGDMLCDLDRDLGRLLLAFGDRMRRRGHRAICIDFVGSERFAEALEQQLYFEREGTKRPLCIRFGADTPPEVMERLGQERLWLMLEGALDI